MTRPPLDQVTLVNDQDEVVGSMDKVDAHRGEGKLHRASSVYLFKKKGERIEFLLQQRSNKKIVGAQLWANTCCGNVRPIESYEECAYRRLREELGITNAEIKSLTKFQYFARCGMLNPAAKAAIQGRKLSTPINDDEEFCEREIIKIYAGWYDDKVTPNPDEVQNYQWVDWEELKEKTRNSKLETNNFNTKQIQTKNLIPDTLNLEPNITLAPWFVLIMADKNVQQALEKFIN